MSDEPLSTALPAETPAEDVAALLQAVERPGQRTLGGCLVLRQGALLRIELGALWQFRTGAGVLSVEDSLWVDGDGRPHPTRQLVVTSEALPGGSSIGWLFKRVG